MKKQLFLLLSLGLFASQSLTTSGLSHNQVKKAEAIGAMGGGYLTMLGGAAVMAYNPKNISDFPIYLASIAINAGICSKFAGQWTAWNSTQKTIGALASLVGSGLVLAYSCHLSPHIPEITKTQSILITSTIAIPLGALFGVFTVSLKDNYDYYAN